MRQKNITKGMLQMGNRTTETLGDNVIFKSRALTFPFTYAMSTGNFKMYTNATFYYLKRNYNVK